ncbi:putative molybdenum carrier protein [Desulfosediminicola ganghwensis]|uniref:putative molybdenum carrier protein n=1 Tax=Desulfosediminicola ganghwensis TaxID=2569540 RepID=UPI0010ACB205|nr:putative molybdenum carrier protein [Desulfosediminicola ganghwensis]
MKPILKKIVSGGQTGADRAALDAAIEHGFAHGGWLPKGRKTEDGPLPEKYALQEMTSSDYRKRTRQNVIDSDGTLIVSHGGLTGGSLLTLVEAKKMGSPCLHLDLEQVNGSEALLLLVAWLIENSIKTLNVAGPRASSDPVIYQQVYLLVSGLLVELKGGI